MAAPVPQPSLLSRHMRSLVLMIGAWDHRLERYRVSLRAGGFAVIATDDADAPRLLIALRPAVCVIDVCSLKAQGWELCEAIRENPSLRSIAIAIIATTTGHSRRALTARAGRLNGTLLVTPLRSNDLVDCVATLIGLRPARPITATGSRSQS